MKIIVCNLLLLAGSMLAGAAMAQAQAQPCSTVASEQPQLLQNCNAFFQTCTQQGGTSCDINSQIYVVDRAQYDRCTQPGANCANFDQNQAISRLNQEYAAVVPNDTAINVGAPPETPPSGGGGGTPAGGGGNGAGVPGGGAVLAQNTGSSNITYVPLEPLPGGFQKDQANISNYVHSGFLVLITLGGFFAVLLIVIGGISYMFGEVGVETKMVAKRRIRNALFGILLLAGSWLLLNTINPQLTHFETLFTPTPGGAAGATASAGGDASLPIPPTPYDGAPGSSQDTACRTQPRPANTTCAEEIMSDNQYHCACD